MKVAELRFSHTNPCRTASFWLSAILLNRELGKYSKENPFFTIGGILVPEAKVLELDNTLTQIQSNFFGSSSLVAENEFHGKEMFHGKGPFKGRKLPERIEVFDYFATFLISNAIPIRLVRIDVERHRRKYQYPVPEYRLGLMLFLERACDYLDEVHDLGIAFGDYERDEVARSVVDFSEYKTSGKTPMYFGRPLGRLVDTVYFTRSHHSRFLQLADVVVYMAGRYLPLTDAPEKWHDARVFEIWEKIKASAALEVQHWP